MTDIIQFKNELILNGSNLTDYGFNSDGFNSVHNGLGLYPSMCEQLNSYFIKMGLAIIILYIVSSWFLWWFFKHGYKMLNNKKIGFIGDLSQLETRIYWDNWIRLRISKIMLGYILVNVWFNI